MVMVVFVVMVAVAIRTVVVINHDTDGSGELIMRDSSRWSFADLKSSSLCRSNSNSFIKLRCSMHEATVSLPTTYCFFFCTQAVLISDNLIRFVLDARE
jgi:hypothetical protein